MQTVTRTLTTEGGPLLWSLSASTIPLAWSPEDFLKRIKCASQKLFSMTTSRNEMITKSLAIYGVHPFVMNLRAFHL